MSGSRLAVGLLLCSAAACAPKTGLLLEVRGPTDPTSVAAGVTSLHLVASHRSYCDRWIADQQASTLDVDVTGRDLDADPITILLLPDRQTNGIVGYNDEQPDPVRAVVEARAADGRLLGVATFDPHPFVYEEVRKYTARVALFQRTDAAYASADGCLCAPGAPSIGNGSGGGCDPQIPPAFDRLVDTAGCELPAGATLPVGACDGQLYPGERQNRELPCFVTGKGGCRVGHRTCVDKDGLGYDAECLVDDGQPQLPGSTLCDAYLGCEQNACQDPGVCLQAGATRKTLHCTLPVAPDAVDGRSVACAGGSWAYVFDGLSGAACVSTMLDGTRQGPLEIGWRKEAGGQEPQLVASFCAPALLVGAAYQEPDKLPSQLTFAISVGEQIYDVVLAINVGCPAASMGTPAANLRCQ